MVINNIIGSKSKLAARLVIEAGRINRNITVTVSTRSPEAPVITGRTQRRSGWHKVTEYPVLPNGRKDYVRFLKETVYKDIWIRCATRGGRSVIYVR